MAGPDLVRLSVSRGAAAPSTTHALSSTSKKKKRRKRRPRAAPQQSAGTAAGPAKPPPRPRRAARPGSPDERPPAPWGSFPLVELVVLVGILMLVGGFIVGADQARGQTMIGTGIVLASLAGLELSIREHFSGYRSHTALLAAAAGVGTILVLYYLVKLEATPSLVAGAAVALAAGWALVRAFRARTGRTIKVR